MELAGPIPELISDSETPNPHPYLSEFTRLGEQIYYYSPPSLSPPSEGEEITVSNPDLIIICSWMYAFPKHIAKYIQNYRSKYPSSPILLLRQDGGDFFYRTNKQQMKNFEPAISTIRQLANHKSDSDRLNVLTHVFSNGGAWTACQLSDAYLDTTAEVLPISALILDSTPSLPNPEASHSAICEALPKTPAVLNALGSVAVWGYISLAQALDKLTGAEHLALNIRRRLNDPMGAFMQNALRRVYIYSQGDKLIPAGDVEAHASDATEIMGGNGQEKVTLEDFGPTRHVSHMLGDPGRYWDVVERVWQGSMA